jgi:hypothetical protein
VAGLRRTIVGQGDDPREVAVERVTAVDQGDSWAEVARVTLTIY